jgi:carboxyl-terminal processing protease
LTTARYFTPSGRSIQAKGITPDIVVEETANGSSSRSRVREADLERHLSGEGEKGEKAEPAPAKPTAKPADKKDKGKTEEAEDSPHAPIEFASPKDYQLGQAVNLLKAWQIIKR